MLDFRPYQQDLETRAYEGWGHYLNVLLTLPTGGGKTVIFSKIIKDNRGPSMVIAHRQELVSQISTSLADAGVYHNIIAPANVIRWICGTHSKLYGRHFYNPKALANVAGVDTLIRRAHKYPRLCKSITLWVIDECHHVLRKNKWGTAVSLFPNARGLGVTATPLRADRCGLGRNASGVFDIIIEGPCLRDLIDAGYLSEYIVYNSYNTSKHGAIRDVGTTSTGDFSPPKLKLATQKSGIVGDIVGHYKKYALGKRGVTFVPDVETAGDVAERFRAAGVPAKAVHAKTPAQERQNAVTDLDSGKLLNLVNCDLFGEGFNLPTIEVINDAAATMSYGRFNQRFGRLLRTAKGKLFGSYIDHVGNTMEHGLPDYGRVWSLADCDKRSAAKDPDLIPVRTCAKCSAVYPGYSTRCPYCSHTTTPLNRSAPEFVDGDLTLLDPEAMEALRGERARIDAPASSVADKLGYMGAHSAAVQGAIAQHNKRQQAQKTLRGIISIWAGFRRAKGVPDAESYREFYHKFGVDVMTAQTFGRPAAQELTDSIIRRLD